MQDGILTIEFWTKSKVLKDERKRRKMSLLDVAINAAITPSYLSQIENNKRSCTEDLFLKILVKSFDFSKQLSLKILKECRRDLEKLNSIKSIYYL